MLFSALLTVDIFSFHSLIKILVMIETAHYMDVVVTHRYIPASMTKTLSQSITVGIL